MKTKVDYKPANKVRVAKIVIIVLAVLCAIVSVLQLVQGNDLGFTMAGMAIGFFVLSSLIEGFAAIVDAACEYSWEFDKRHEENAEPKMDDSEVQ